MFPQSITACLRLDVKTKHQTWKLGYTCMSISTVLTNGTTLAPIMSSSTMPADGSNGEEGEEPAGEDEEEPTGGDEEEAANGEEEERTVDSR